jgi:hypothetical protein
MARDQAPMAGCCWPCTRGNTGLWGKAGCVWGNGHAGRSGFPHESNLRRGQGVGLVDEVAEGVLQGQGFGGEGAGGCSEKLKLGKQKAEIARRRERRSGLLRLALKRSPGRTASGENMTFSWTPSRWLTKADRHGSCEARFFIHVFEADEGESACSWARHLRIAASNSAAISATGAEKRICLPRPTANV